ncbi:MAG: DUF5107 domain-containing protein [Caldilineaceae bacterium]|nr:DUF5107 domain-containing protein [Caldilineaceae bacterium]
MTWPTYAYELTPNHTIVDGSFDGATIVERTFDTWILENRYLKVTLLPEFGGRVISMIYKPTGHEQLYRNPVGVPYLIGEGIFYYDWLMIYGGIFPTFPEPEHGKSWLLPWKLRVVSQTEQAITIAMSFTDDIDNPSTPGQYAAAATGIEATFLVTLQADRAAIETEVELFNPGQQVVQYEYWTNAGLAPGSSPGNPKATDAAEIVAPVEQVEIPDWSDAIANQELPPTRPMSTTLNVEKVRKLARNGRRVCLSRHAGQQLLGRDRSTIRRGNLSHCRQPAHARSEDMDLRLSE